MIIRFRDFRDVHNYGKEIFKTDNPETTRQFMRDHNNDMRFLVGGGKEKNGERIEIYWDIVNK